MGNYDYLIKLHKYLLINTYIINDSLNPLKTVIFMQNRIICANIIIVFYTDNIIRIKNGNFKTKNELLTIILRK